jgi:hypothetical protein
MPRTFVPLVVACWLALLVVPLIGQLDPVQPGDPLAASVRVNSSVPPWAQRVHFGRDRRRLPGPGVQRHELRGLP